MLSAKWYQAKGDKHRVASENHAKSQSMCTARARKKLSAWEFYLPYRISLVVHRIRGTEPDYKAHILRWQAKGACVNRYRRRFRSYQYYLAAAIRRKYEK